MIRKSLAIGLLTIVAATGLPTVKAQDDPSTDGVWLSHGYGMVIEINGDETTIYDITPVSCAPLFDSAMLQEYHVQFVVENGELIVHDDKTLYITAAALDELPALCANGGTVSDDPELNFEAFWNDFNQQYAFFDLYGVDWQAQYDQYRPLVTTDTTPEELFSILSDMIRPLTDHHISLSNGQADFSPAMSASWLADDPNPILTIFGLNQVVAQNFFEGRVSLNPTTLTLEGDETLIANRFIFYGRLSATVGYINIPLETAYTDDDSDVAAAGEAMDRIVAEFADLDTIIIDVRFNLGGDDAVALALASRFADEKRLVTTKQARDGDGFTPTREFYVEPGGPQQFTKQVIVLTSDLTVSAGETFVLAMDVLPHVTMVGGNTAGAYSDILSRALPNGWQFGLSNEKYTAADGEVYEKVGNPPDVVVLFDVEQFQAGTDDILNAALELAAQ
ncbi:MAG: S41 family peptidase [Chloroflexi bacterium]|nr:S41 family peptidase [Chloroflexota bacterium]